MPASPETLRLGASVREISSVLGNVPSPLPQQALEQVGLPTIEAGTPTLKAIPLKTAFSGRLLWSEAVSSGVHVPFGRFVLA
jgi:hypothetical protein